MNYNNKKNDDNNNNNNKSNISYITNPILWKVFGIQQQQKQKHHHRHRHQPQQKQQQHDKNNKYISAITDPILTKYNNNRN